MFPFVGGAAVYSSARIAVFTIVRAMNTLNRTMEFSAPSLYARHSLRSIQCDKPCLIQSVPLVWLSDIDMIQVTKQISKTYFHQQSASVPFSPS
mmetsp:Transcript_13978/g.38303  ORF Transcript_13978/g.38303 Transcript_13978/m.38303 type:complete len:94 (-) Transcript_13978:70-351(-)